LYSATELLNIARICRENNLLLYVDGARMAYGLASKQANIDLPLIAQHADAFCIGGTKCGAMFGEALVFPDPAQVPPQFQASIRQHGALLAKGWLVGQQFQALFAEHAHLYRSYGEKGCERAQEVLKVLEKHQSSCGMELVTPVQTNQVFVRVDDVMKERLARAIAFADWRRAGEGSSVIRFVTSWATTDADIAGLDSALAAIGRRRGQVSSSQE
jgi:threonine aldolase